MATRDSWLDTAVSGIRFRPDREKVRQELQEHLEDKTLDLRRIFPGMEEQEAQDRALAGMGDVQEVKAALAKVHKPWLGWLWQASRWLVWGMWMLFLVFNLADMKSGYDSFRGQTGSRIYHRIQGGQQAELGGYTFQITGAACVDRPERAKDTLQIIVRAASPRFWERIGWDALPQVLTAVGPDGTRYPMAESRSLEYTVETEPEGITRRSYLYIGVHLCSWEPFWREFEVCIPAEGWQPGDQVTLELDSEAGSISLSVPVTERVVIP